MHENHPTLTVAFHACEKKDGINLVRRKKLKPIKSDKSYDWLGKGFYCWENNFERAVEWSKTKSNPFVIGLYLDLGNCLDLLNQKHINIVNDSYKALKHLYKISGKTLPINKSGNDSSLKSDKVLRFLDRAVIENVHDIISKMTPESEYDSIRGMFPEGKLLYPNAGFRKKNHIQICVRNPKMIKAFFIPNGYKF